MTNRPSSGKRPTLDYAGGPRDTSCVMVIFQTVGGALISGSCKLVVHFVVPAGASDAVIAAVAGGVFVAALAAVVYLALLRRPGFLIGFMIVSSLQGLLVAACGIRMMR